MPAQVFRTDDVHNEHTGPVAHGPVLHLFEASPNATQTVMFVEGRPLLCRGDGFEHSGASHVKPQVGASFTKPDGVMKRGEFTAAGQGVLFIEGRPVMTMAGQLETCSDATKETTCDAAILLAEVPPMFVEGHPVLPGCN